ncbi:MAG TPA: helix-turn-helix domain-containing protein [Vicinamibacterales bacterium]|jgi:DNA-binding NtrC family response regulator
MNAGVTTPEGAGPPLGRCFLAALCRLRRRQEDITTYPERTTMAGVDDKLRLLAAYLRLAAALYIDFSRAHVTNALSVSGNRMDEAAKLLGLSRKGLYLKRERLGLLETSRSQPDAG